MSLPLRDLPSRRKDRYVTSNSIRKSIHYDWNAYYKGEIFCYWRRFSGISKLFPRGSNIQTETPEASGRWIGEVVAAWVAKAESSAHSPGGSI